MNKLFIQSKTEQRSPEWFAERCGKVSASRLGDFMDYTKAGKAGAKRKAYLAELAFENTFNTTFEKFQTKAMFDGVAYENFAKLQYAQATNNIVEETSSFISKRYGFVATPDGLVGDDGLVECKVVGDNSFMDLIINGVPNNHMLQMQAQIWATGRKWCDYVVVNLKTKSFKITHVERDDDIIKSIRDELKKPLEIEQLDTTSIKHFTDEDLLDYNLNRINNLAEDIKIDF